MNKSSFSNRLILAPPRSARRKIIILLIAILKATAGSERGRGAGAGPLKELTALDAQKELKRRGRVRARPGVGGKGERGMRDCMGSAHSLKRNFGVAPLSSGRVHARQRRKNLYCRVQGKDRRAASTDRSRRRRGRAGAAAGSEKQEGGCSQAPRSAEKGGFSFRIILAKMLIRAGRRHGDAGVPAGLATPGCCRARDHKSAEAARAGPSIRIAPGAPSEWRVPLSPCARRLTPRSSRSFSLFPFSRPARAGPC